jgi:hypothetical protein
MQPDREAGRTFADQMADAGFSQAEVDRAVCWFEAAVLAREPVDLDRLSEWEALQAEASAGAVWLYCRLEHGPGLCEVECPGKFLHRPPWQPSKAPIRW